LSADLKQRYQEAADTVISGMGPDALAAWHNTAVSTHFFASIKDVDAKFKELKAEKGETAGKGTTPAFTDVTGGKAEFYINGGRDTPGNPAKAAFTANYYAHEFAHAVDLHAGYSQKQEWHEAWKADREYIATAMGRKTEDPKEAFCDFAAHAWTDRTGARNGAPQSWNAWTQWGLV